MTNDRFKRVRKLFDQAVELPTEERMAFVRKACQDDPVALEQVRQLLEQFAGESESFESAPTVAPSVFGSAVIESGQTVGPYKIGRKIGEGGMGVVYKATQEEPLRRTVAIKVIKEGFLDSKQVIWRFEGERQALALMNHPNIARVLDAGADSAGRPYFVMEYIAGVSITDYCDRHDLTTNERLELLIQVCEGVQHAHQKGVIHRDIKPSNILVEIQNDKPVPRIIDFGVAKAIDQELTGQTLFTEYGKIIGTPEYMSPEQAEMTELDIDTRTDVYSLGVVLYELLVGALPFDSRELRRAGLAEIQRKIREDTPHKPSTRVSTLGEVSQEIARRRQLNPSSLAHQCKGDLDWITMKALEKDRTRRYASASEFAADLRHHLLNEPVSAGPPSAGYRLQKFVRRHRIGVGMAAVLIVMFAVGFAGTAYGLVRALAAERQARLEAATVSEVSDFMFRMFKISDPGEARGATITAREILDRGAQKIRSEMDGQPALQGRLMESMGLVYRSLGLYHDAEPLLLEAVDVTREAYGGRALEVAPVLNSLATIRILRGQAISVLPYLEEALSIQEEHLGEDSPELARTLNNLGGAYRTVGRFEDAAAVYERALDIRRSALGPEHPDVAKMWSNVGAVRIQLGDFEGARDALKWALGIREKILPSNHPDLAKTLNSLGELYYKTGEFEKGRTTAARVIALQEETLGDTHPFLVNSLLNLALNEIALGDLPAAREHLERALAIGEARLQPKDRRVGTIRGELMKVYDALGETEKADEIRALQD